MAFGGFESDRPSSRERRFSQKRVPAPRIPELRSAGEIMSATPNPIPIAPNGPRPTRHNQRPGQPQKSPKSEIPLPLKVLRLESSPILCFHRLTTNFNLTMLRLERRCSVARRLLAVPPSHLTSNCVTSDNVVPATRRVLASGIQV